jgi:hypothetical protein
MSVNTDWLPQLLQVVAGGYHRPARPDHVAAVFLEDSSHLEALAWAPRLLHAESIVFVPDGTSVDPRWSFNVVSYRGAFAQPGDILSLGDFELELQDYLGSSYLAASGPVVVRVGHGEDYEDFLADADLALAEGSFPAALTNPAVTLADTCCLGGAPACAGLGRLHVDAERNVRTSASGRILGEAGVAAEVLAAVAGSRPCRHERSFGRPWLGRYVAAIEALRRMAAHERRECRVSGFGVRLVDGLPIELQESVDAPLLLFDEAGGVLVSVDGTAALRLGRDAAAIAEVVLSSRSDEEATQLVAALLGHTPRVAIAAVATVHDRIASLRPPLAVPLRPAVAQ